MRKHLFIAYLSGVVLILFGLASVSVLIGCGSSKRTSATANQPIATVTHLSIDMYHFALAVELTPTTAAKANTTYTAQLLENGNPRTTASVSFSQAQINAAQPATIDFTLTSDELTTYQNADLYRVFSVSIS
jgi:hypothetical protein